MVFKNFLSKAKDIDILSSIPDGIIMIDNDGKIEWINDIVPVFFRKDKKEILKQKINEIIDGGLDLAKQAAETVQPVVGRVKSEIGLDTYFEITSKVIGGFYVLAIRDVTKNYKTVSNIMVEHESSRKVTKDKNNFLIKLSSELKSPLQSILGFSQAMVDGLGGEMSEKQEKYIKIIHKNSTDILYLINKIIELAKTESKFYEYDFQIFDVVNAIQSVLKESSQVIKNKNLNVTFDSEEIIKKTIYLDEAIFKVIVQTLLETSINSTDIGSISIKISHPEMELVSEQNLETSENIGSLGYLMLTVSDTGAGISEGDLDVIFEPYAQLEKINKKNIVRSIALASVRNLVKSLNGAIWVESEIMQGASYKIIIPIEKELHN